MKNKSVFKKVYLLSLIPLLSIALYLVSLVFCSDAILYFVEYGFTAEVYLALGIFLSMVAFWAYCGFLFSRSKVALGRSVLIANALPILATGIFFVLYVVYKINGSEDLFAIAELIGGLGNGAFGILGEIIFMIFNISVLFQVFISFGVCMVVFMLGYAIGGPIARKDKQAMIEKMEQEKSKQAVKNSKNTPKKK